MYEFCTICGRPYSGTNCLRCTQQAITVQVSGFGAETLGRAVATSDISSKHKVVEPMAKLKVTSDGHLHAVPRPICRIGSDPDNDIVISNDDAVARFHAQISFDEAENEYVLRDLGTKDGTYLNATRSHLDQVIFGGDMIKIGKQKFYFVSDLPL
ncbi:MAG: FHA domain-containing protein [Candidatus Obscuribacterales bacterium]|nr:FHA domain-containing protein [Candidatus Obscuribacterales bacterium]